MVIEAISREFRVALPWELLYADNLVVIAETEDLIKRFNELLGMADHADPVVKLSYLRELVWQPSWELDNCPDWLNCG